MSEDLRENFQAALAKGSIVEAQSYLDQDKELLNSNLNNNRSHSLIFANSHLELAKYLVEAGAQVNRGNRYGKTVLMYSAQGGHLDVVKLLIDKGADHKLKDKDGNTALLFAIQHKQIEVISYFISIGVDLFEKEDEFALAPVECVRDVEHVERILRESAVYAKSSGIVDKVLITPQLFETARN